MSNDLFKSVAQSFSGLASDVRGSQSERNEKGLRTENTRECKSLPHPITFSIRVFNLASPSSISTILSSIPNENIRDIFSTRSSNS